MGDKKKIIIIILSIIILLIITLFNYFNKKDLAQTLKEDDWLSNNIELIKDKSLGNNIYKVYKNNDISIYNLKYQKVITTKINNLISSMKEDYIIIYNPYGTNSLSANVYFKNHDIKELKYEITSDKINPFSKNLKINNDNYGCQIIGLIPGKSNNIRLTLLKEDKSTYYDFTIDLSDIEINAEKNISYEDGTSKKELNEGLYAMLGNESDYQDYIALYDNFGTIRSEFPIKNNKAYSLIKNDDYLYFNISNTEIIRMNNLGQITNIYKTGKYHIKNDYIYYENTLLLLATEKRKDSINDCLIKIDVETNELTEVISFSDFFKEYIEKYQKGNNELDYFDFNSFVIMDNNLVISSKETSSIFKISNPFTTPKLEYIISNDSFWKDSSFNDYVFNKIGDFKIHSGQNSIHLKKESATSYYLTFFNNNYGFSKTRPDFDYNSINIKNNNPYQGDTSYYYSYYIDETSRSFSLVTSFDLEYSGIYGNIDILNNSNILVTSSTNGTFAEYDDEHNLIRRFKPKINKYSIYKIEKI